MIVILTVVKVVAVEVTTPGVTILIAAVVNVVALQVTTLTVNKLQ
jgi:hypothetical protein